MNLDNLNKEQKEVLGMALFWAENSSEKCEKLRKLAKSKEIYKRKKYDGYRISQCSENTRKTIVSFNKIHYIWNLTWWNKYDNPTVSIGENLHFAYGV